MTGTVKEHGSALSRRSGGTEAENAAAFWEQARRELYGPGESAVNIASLAVERSARLAGGDRPAIVWLGADGNRKEFSFRQLSWLTSRFATILLQLGIKAGETIFSLTGRVPLLYVALLGSLQHRCLFSPLFVSFGPEPVCQRLARGDGVLLVTTRQQYLRKVEPYRQSLPALRHVLLLDTECHLEPGVWSLPRLLEEATADYCAQPTGVADPSLLHFTSGTTGPPKGAVHVHGAAVGHYVTGRHVFGLSPGERFWCTADPGWVTGVAYSVITPLLHGCTTIIDEAEFDASRWLDILERERINIFYTSPTAIRLLKRLDGAVWKKHRFPYLRAVFSVGEPLDSHSVLWGKDTFGSEIHDTWWQTETGVIMIANTHDQSVRPGLMGKPIPGITAAILDPSTMEPLPCGRTGMLALRSGWPSMFASYIHDEERYRRCFAAGWYLTGDLAAMDEKGWFRFTSRADDIIKTAGHMVGPFEVEAVLASHPRVAEAAVYGLPDPLLGEVVAARVVLHGGNERDEALRTELLGYARQRLGPAIAPRLITFSQVLPKNRAGKIMRRLLATGMDQPQEADGA